MVNDQSWCVRVVDSLFLLAFGAFLLGDDCGVVGDRVVVGDCVVVGGCGSSKIASRKRSR